MKSTDLSALGVDRKMQHSIKSGASVECILKNFDRICDNMNDLSERWKYPVLISLIVDYVQRFNFSVTDDGAITFRSPQSNTEGYATMLVFDKAGASTVLAKSIFYNEKVRPKMIVPCSMSKER